MKRKGRHPDKALTALGVRALKEPGRYADGNGLYLVVDPSGSKRWLLRTVAQGRRRDMGLGSASLVSLAEARELAVRHRKIAREGGDPIQARKSEKVAVPTFAEAVEQVHADHTPGWRNDKHAAQWINTLRTYAIPLIGDRLVNSIETPDILTVLSPIWLTKPETARRVRQRLKVILDWAKTAGHRSGENPVLGVDRGLPKQPKKSGHHKALPYGQTPAFVKALRMQNATVRTKLAFEFLILTAARTGEVLGATWSEVDQAAKVWTIPA
ncbi:tyrosine-type recombinase/integrase [Methylopila henanensis]|uniref:Tyrosine-type recombinase/integrase n=1 Tax=Methylopila henanensis TaxID=873516 RepID=A0ABW4K6P8_9HYPH